MIIRKLYKFEVSHIVRNCSSKRCSHSIHGHSVKLEVLLTADKLDNGEMIYDFGLMKGTIKDFIDSFDHCLVVWNKDKDLVEIAKQYSDRYIILPCNTSAEAQAIMFVYVINEILKHTETKNGEGNVRVHSVRYHETDTGYAEATLEDIKLLPDFDINKIIISDEIKKEWNDYNMWDKLLQGIRENKKVFENPEVQKQV